MKDLKQSLEEVIDRTFRILQQENTGTKLVFPSYSNNKRRVSEQELRFVFVEQMQSFLSEYNLFYSVETPTTDKYIFSSHGTYCTPQVSEKGQSASFDLTIKDAKGANLAIIEFKAKNATPHEYAKDLCKLWNSKEKAQYKYFLNLFEAIKDSTIRSFKNKLISQKGNKYLPEKTTNEQVYVIAQSLNVNDPIIKFCV